MNKQKLEKLRKKHEWTLGNGQCKICGGMGPSFYHPEHHNPYRQPEDIGHEKNCLFALGMQALGLEPIFIGEFLKGCSIKEVSP